jgi:vitellogenic carboxypeptidase-like protein
MAKKLAPQQRTKKNAEDQVTHLPEIGPVGNVQFAGYASVYPRKKQPKHPAKEEAIFYWFAGAENYEKKPTILWSNGGPGCSSLWGFFIENGPYCFKENQHGKFELKPNPHSWSRHANYLIFEHPLGVTLSFHEDTNTLPQNVGAGIEQLYQALQHFVAKHPEIADNPIILAGESYAGTYLPLLAKAIIDGNKSKDNISLHLETMVLLDSWVNPMVQMATDTAYALNHGMITAAQKQELDEKYNHNLPQINQAIQQICGLYMTNIAQIADPPFQPVLDYINRADVRKAIHVKQDTPVKESWSAAIGNLYAFGVNDSYASTVQELLGRGLQTIVISGLNDAKDCNFLGTGAWLSLLEGEVARKFKDAQTRLWKGSPSQGVLGYIQDGGKLSWVKVLNAGHMAARDQPLLINLIKEMSHAWR